MKAVSFYKSLPIEDPQSFVDVSMEAPSHRSHALVESGKTIGKIVLSWF